MATIKSYTDIEQSKKLAEILPLESSDTIWDLTNPDLSTIRAIPYEDSDYNNKYLNIIPAWSLTALLSVLQGTNISTPDSLNKIRYSCWNDYDIAYASNPVDACVEMIVKLKEKDLL